MDLEMHQSDAESENCRKILSLAALFENEFNIDWLQDLTREKASQVLAALDLGMQKKWLSGQKKGFFSFIDAEEQQKLRDALPLHERKNLHQGIADLLFRELSDDPNKIQSIITHLLYLSNDLNGCRLLIEGGNLREKHYQFDNARQAYGKAIEDLRRLEGKDADSLFIKAVLQYSRVCMEEIGVDGTISILEEAIRLAEAKKDDNALVLLEMYLAKNEWIRSRFQVARQHFKRGWVLAEKLGHPKIKRSAAIFNLFFSYWMGRYRDAVQNYEMFAPDVETFPKNSMPLLASLTAGTCYGFCGQYSQGLGMLDAIRSHSMKMGNLYIAGHAGIAMGGMLVEIQHFDEARRYLEESLKETRSSHNLFAYAGGLTQMSYACHLMNDQKKAFSYLSEYIELRDRAQVAMRHGYVLMHLAWEMENGALPKHKGFELQNEIQIALQMGNVFTKGLAYRYRAFLKKRDGASPRDVMDDLKRSIRYLSQSGNQIQLANSKAELAREYLRFGNKKRAQIWAVPVVEVLSSLNDDMIPDDIRCLAKFEQNGNNLLDEILQLSQELVTIRDSRDLFRQIISVVNRITGAERGAIFLANDQNPPELLLRAAKNLTAEDITMPHFHASIQLIKETFKSGKGRIMDLDGRGDAFPREYSAIRSCICVPMSIRNKIVGVLYHDNRIFRSGFKETDLKVLNYFAAQAAIAMDNVQAWQALQDMYDKQQMEKEYYESQYLQSILSEDFIGKSPGIVNVFNQVEQVAATDATVLIMGETGVGKELVARSIHRHSSRCDKPFIRVHCSALPESLISSELFGHEKGAFTGASMRQIGRFELANGGTLFLDEIGDISMEIQVKLLRVLQSKEFERVGGRETLRSDFRLLAATNKDLQKEVQAGRFREDLYYRLNVFPVKVPPLRERKEDIPLLVHYFLKTCAAKLGKPVKKITRNEMNRLMNYDWPGNVRELENLIERGLILSKGSDYKVPHFEPQPSPSAIGSGNLTLMENERSHILNVLSKTRGKITGKGGAAEVLAVPPSTLKSRMKKLGIRKQYLSLAPTKEAKSRNHSLGDI